MQTIQNYRQSSKPGSDELLFCALGGLGAIGMNFYLYGHKGKWLIVDFGIGFAGDDIPGVDILTPDPAFIEERKNDIVGLVLTHAHEDHLGALAYLFSKLNCKVFATKFTANVAANKLLDGGFKPDDVLEVIEAGAKFNLMPFELEFVNLTHSIPEPQGLIIRTSVGTVFHTGDWKFDSCPLLGKTSDMEKLKKLGSEGVLAIVGDSTNVMSEGRSETEGSVKNGLNEVVSKLKGKVAITCFASNIARLQSIGEVARDNGRKVALVGRSLWRMVECAIDAGYLKNCPKFYEADEINHMDSNKKLYICTGSQGEFRAAMARIARGDNPKLSLGSGDTVIFSARAIPGNEKSIAQIQNSLVTNGVHIITAKDAMVHASGHGSKSEIEDMYNLVKPKFAIPMHGEAIHLSRHGQLAQDIGISKSYILENGSLVSICENEVKVVDEIYTGVFALDGDKFSAIDSAALRQRKKMSFGGLVVATIVIANSGELLSAPLITCEGIHIPLESDREDLFALVEKAFEAMSRKDKMSDDKLREIVRFTIRRCLFKHTGKKSKIKIHLVRV